MKRIQSKLHRIETYDDGVSTLAYFHKEIKKMIKD